MISEIGCSLETFIDRFLSGWNPQRRRFVRHLENTLKSLCSEIFRHFKITHRDIRP
jgi:hypothetical protein